MVPVVIVGLIVILVVAFFAFQGKKKENTQTVVESVVSPTGVNSVSVKPTGVSQSEIYKDGTYTAVGDYTSPGGAENIGVTVTLKNDVIESADVKSMAERPNTIKFQGIFIENYKPLVIGKNIDEVKLDRVSGSSLSPKGFNDALDKIKAEAKA
jgi:uncharacterized protein with FMN-binding domain